MEKLRSMDIQIHWKAPLQPKGFLKIIEMVIALLALSLVAGFTATSTSHCNNYVNSSRPADIIARSPYPYGNLFLEIHFQPNKSDYVVPADAVIDLGSGYLQGGSFFVAWGSLSLFYGVIALCVYMFTTASSNIEWLVNYLVLTDLIFHIVWVLCWFIASIEWAVAQSEMPSDINERLFQFINLNCTGPADYPTTGSYAQAAIADVFGFTSVIIWAVNIIWVVIDTSFYMQWKARRSGNSDTRYDTI